ncbi:hypothetical protein CVV68_06745 [Arthrobacter livingstonensis]|uniref:Uncharacterized protein n=1 Tax=Arthrobacter livingstonensis TaxID=670078 RepID=A0A2V5LA89_9MICC|nr:hypothetical protein [Arthrobacter livingstonensis]PYI68495.1 hypothetical protein CVV68_06745 [Arthrobacter livingstonensis]
MSGAVWVVVAVGVFALVIVAMVVLLVVGRLRGRVPDPDAGPPEFVPHPRGESIPPTGSR